MFGELKILQLKVIFLGDFSFVKIFLTKLSCSHDNYFKYSMFGKYNGLSARRGVSACMYFLVIAFLVVSGLDSYFRLNVIAFAHVDRSVCTSIYLSLVNFGYKLDEELAK
jgi:hypothetical protein